MSDTSHDQLIADFLKHLNELLAAVGEDQQEAALETVVTQYVVLLDFLTETQLRELIQRHNQPPNGALH
jgi:hypothetical protein